MIDHSQCVVGVDLGDQKSLACVYAHGTIVSWFEFAMTPEAVKSAFEGKGFLRIALEAGAQSGWVTRLLRSLGYEPVVANPRKLKIISANQRKSDRNDAWMLAKLVWADASLLHPIQHRSEERALALTVINARDAAVTARTKLINTVRSMAKAFGGRLKKGTADGFVQREAELPATLAPATTGLFAVLRSLNEQISAYDTELTRMIETSFPEALRVQQVRGVGPVTALAFVLTLEDPNRFPDGRTAAAFIGLVPKRDQSGAIDRQLRISKTGNGLLRRLLVQCAQYILGPLGRDCDLRLWGHKLMERGGKSAKKRAIVAAARKLAVLLFRLWKTGDVWVPLHNHAAGTESLGAEALPASEQADMSTDVDVVNKCNKNIISSEKRPEPAISSDCVCFPGASRERAARRIDCSTGHGSDPSMHQALRGPSESADRSMGHRMVSPVNTCDATTKAGVARPPQPEAPQQGVKALPPTTDAGLRKKAATSGAVRARQSKQAEEQEVIHAQIA
jgi:transposase